VKRIHGTSLGECVEDTTDAYRWLCDHADELSIDPERIASGGGSAGATLAAVLGVDGAGAGDRPGALLLCNPAFYSGDEQLKGAAERFGFRPEEMGVIDIASRLGTSLPPSWLWYGDQDRLYHQGKPVIEAMRRVTPRFELLVADGADHGYFNDYEKYYRESIESLDRFLVSIGYTG
jgi:acetyl esterase